MIPSKHILLLLLPTLLWSGCSKYQKRVPLPELLSGGIIDSTGKPIPSTDILKADYLLLYFSAHWCPPCRAFTPKLVNFYNTNGGGARFIALFISADQDEKKMIDYMREAKMPWPAIKYRSESAKALADRYSGDGIPRLVLINMKGAVLADSYEGRSYVGPQKVLSQFAKLLAAKYPTQPDIEIKPESPTTPSPAEQTDTGEQLRKKYKVTGFGKGSQGRLAVINNELKGVGDELDSGVLVLTITENHVELFASGERHRLYPEK